MLGAVVKVVKNPAVGTIAKAAVVGGLGAAIKVIAK